MKSEHRHELKTNELADWLAHFPDWARENAKSLMAGGALIVVVLIVLGWNHYNRSVRVVRENVRFSNLVGNLVAAKQEALNNPDQDGSFALESAASDLEDYAERASKKSVKAMAYLKAAEALRAALHFTRTPLSAGDLEQKLTAIAEIYEKAIDAAGSNASIEASARYGLGLCLEEQGRFDEARQTYEEIAQDERLAGTAGRVAALDRLAILDDVQQPVAFAPAPEPVSMPELTPQLEAADSNDALPAVGPVAPNTADTNAAAG